MMFLQRTGYLYFLVQISVNIIPSSAYFQSTVNGYVFSIPDVNDRERRTQADAQTWCIGNRSKLLEITSDSIQRSVVTFINNARSQNQMTEDNAITNGKRFTSSLTWVNGIVYRSNISVNGQANGLSFSYGYLSSSQIGFEYYVDVPTARRGYICEGSAFCSNEVTINGRCFKSNNEALSWFDARNRCLNGGGDIASFDFISDVKGFSALNGSGWNTPSTYWIGLQREKWTWLGSNSDIRYSQWADGNPVYTTNPINDCICLGPNTPNFDWKWIVCDCSSKYQFACLSGTASTSSTTSSTASSSSITSTTARSTINGMPSTTLTTYVSRTSSLYPPTSSPSVSMSGGTFATELSSSTSANASASGSNTATAVGLGVGLGVGIPMAIVILVLTLVIIRLRRKPASSESNKSIPLGDVQTSDKEGNATTYEALKTDGQGTENRTYEELNTREER